MFFMDERCMKSLSLRFGVIWYCQESFPFLLFTLLTLLLEFLAPTSGIKFSICFTFFFLPIKKLISIVVKCIMKARTVDYEYTVIRWFCKLQLCLKDTLFGVIFTILSTLMYILGAFVAEIAILLSNANITANNSAKTSNIYTLVWSFIGSSSFYTILWLVIEESFRHRYCGSWKASKYHEDCSQIDVEMAKGEIVGIVNDDSKKHEEVEQHDVINILVLNDIDLGNKKLTDSIQ
mmetsp:Transcript_12571/g.18886  ORF Transcript_12571/g.18886 Transcript_12571/m.18886 type:complete len:235 (+) Transcript_12571:431-1135(+)